jgi:RHS repeat-associated protein
VTSATLGPTATTFSYDGFGAVASQTTTAGGTPRFAVTYARDGLGRIQQQTQTVNGVPRTDAYTYDLAGRRTDVTRNGAPLVAYTYDANGNRLTETTTGGTVVSSYDAQDRLVTSGAATFTYTAASELRTRTVGASTTTYTYDVLGNLTAVALPDGMVVSYVVDGANRRIGRRVNGVPVQGFLYQGQLRPVAELDGARNLVSRFVYRTGVNVPDYFVRGGAIHRIVTDHLGSPRVVVNTATGVIAQELDYDPFGRVVLDTNPGFQPFGFAGGLYDPLTGLVRFGARDYDSETGRWTMKDPIGFARGTQIFSPTVFPIR